MSEMHPFGSGSHAPLDDPNEMPACYPIKGNADSMLYHRPDSRSYGATVAEVWFASPSIAEAAGFRLAGSHPKGVSSADFEPGQAGHPCTAADLTEMGVTAVAHPIRPAARTLPLTRSASRCLTATSSRATSIRCCITVPDSANYGATIAEVWFISPSTAEAAGFSAVEHPSCRTAVRRTSNPAVAANPCSAQAAWRRWDCVRLRTALRRRVHTHRLSDPQRDAGVLSDQGQCRLDVVPPAR